MLPSKLIRWSGLAGLLGGLLFAIPIVFHPLEQNATGFLAPLYVPVHILLIVSIILTLFSLIGLYARQADKTGALGLIGFILAFIGTALVEGLLTFEGLVVPVLSKLDPALVAGLTAPVYTGSVLGYIIGSSMFFALGYIVFGIATFRAGRLPRWAAVLAATGTLGLAGIGGTSQIAINIGGVLFGLGMAWLGYALWSEKGEIVAQAKPPM